MLTNLLLYGWRRHVYSSRKLEALNCRFPRKFLALAYLLPDTSPITAASIFSGCATVKR